MPDPRSDTGNLITAQDDSAQQHEPPSFDVLIATILESMRKTNGTDTALLDILSTTVLATNPPGTAVSDAMKSIEALAAERAERSV